MEIACPACGKRNVDAAECARCGCELEPLIAIRTAAEFHLHCAKAELQAGTCRGALAHAERSWDLVHTLRSARLASVAAAVLGAAEALAIWQRRARQAAEG